MTIGTDRAGSADATNAFATVLSAATGPDDGLGGKGRSLAELVRNGHPIPRTGVISTAAYRRVVEAGDLPALIRTIVGGGTLNADDVDDAFASAAIPDDVERAILATVREVGDGGMVAVRSSATVEDLEGSSFAGQYRSLLNIDSTDDDAVLAAVRRVWSSLWHPAPTAYRRAFGIDDSDVAMAVVVMRMVPATSAGVVFTVDPGGEPGAVRVESVAGLGEALVSGQTTPDAWVVPRESANALPSAPARALELALDIEEMAGSPQDIEWAAVDDEVLVVQARPITVLATDDGFDTPVDDHELTTAGIIEMVPGVLPALRWDLNSFLLEEAFRSVLDSLGIIRGSASEVRPFVRRVRGRAALDFDQLRAAAANVPGAVKELESQYFGVTVEDPTTRPSGRGPSGIISDLRTVQTRRRVVEAAEILIQTVAAFREVAPAHAAMSDDELLCQARRLVDLAARGLAAELGVAASGAAAYQRLEQLLQRQLGAERSAAAVQSVMTTSSGMVEKPTTASAAIFAGETWAELQNTPPAPSRPDPGVHQAHLTALEKTLTSLPGWRRRRILTGQVVDVRIHVIRRTVTEMVEQLERRERTKAAILEIGGHVRRIHLELGSRLRERGVLLEAEDVELLTTRELVDVCTHPAAAPGPDVLRRRRNWLSRYEAEGQLPIRFTGTPERTPTPLPEGDVLSGWAASPGRYRGPARVMRSAQAPFEDGTVLVAEATDASWSPMFVKAGAVVVERGGPLSHAAILARELGLPAVLNVEGATALLDGRTVSVDGDQGLVVIEDDPNGGAT